jgi:hypothetical protein
MGFSFVSVVARRFGVRPRVISDLFYDRILDDSACPIIAGRRCIPEEYIPEVESKLRERGLIASEAAAS